MPDVEMWNQLATAIIHILPTLRDVLELQALVCSGPSEVEELARPAHASPVRLFIGDSPLQGAGSVVQEVDAQLRCVCPGTSGEQNMASCSHLRAVWPRGASRTQV